MRSQLLEALTNVQKEWEASVFNGNYASAKQQSADFLHYKQTRKREWVTEKQEVRMPDPSRYRIPLLSARHMSVISLSRC